MPELNIVEKVIALEGVELLGNLTPEQLYEIASIAEEVSYAPGRTVIDPAQTPESLYVVLDGAVELLRDGQQLHVARQNEVLGAWSLFDDAVMPVTVRTLEDTRLLRIRREDFHDLLADHVELMSVIFSTLVKRFRKLVEG